MVMTICKCCERELPDDTKFCPYCREQVVENNKSKVENLKGTELKGQVRTAKESKTNKVFGSLRGIVVWPFRFLWKHFWLWLIIVALIFGNFGSKRYSQSSNSSNTPYSSSYSPNTSSESFVHDGLYHCSSYHQSQVDQLKPSESEKQSIESAQSDLNSRKEELDNLMTEMNNMGVTQDSPQYLIDEYNEKVNEYNSKNTSYKSDLADLNNRIDAFNASNNAYNNYLEANCSK